MENSQPDIVKKDRVLELAIWRKWNKYIWSGLRWIIAGLVIIIAGLLLSIASFYSAEVLVIGLGIIFVIVGIIRLLIGIINPLSPEDLREIPPPSDEDSILG
jgi:uncharacterized membrane protein HdeD (DUF308 family)